MLEVCIDSLESAVNAIHGGADELEICSSLPEGGLTPSPGLVKEVLNLVNNVSSGRPMYKTCSKCNCPNIKKRVKVNVMIRCRGGSDFCYTQEEMDTMLSDIETYKAMNVDRFVFGALTDTQEIHEEYCAKVIEKTHPIPVTFHRAFDLCREPEIVLEKIILIGFSRVLTSGQRISAEDKEAIQLIESLLQLYGDKIEVMAGAGVNISNAKIFMELGCKIIHSSCKSVRQLVRVENELGMGTSQLYVTDENVVRNTKAILRCST
ncbi:PF03932 family protein CutC [Epargyreus clarus]|uniref:PF03932 family protein CutC n=1 Tax=Epargyreus clarus TaxID=520877 RepID=UPI003C2D8FD3